MSHHFGSRDCAICAAFASSRNIRGDEIHAAAKDCPLRLLQTTIAESLSIAPIEIYWTLMNLPCARGRYLYISRFAESRHANRWFQISTSAGSSKIPGILHDMPTLSKNNNSTESWNFIKGCLQMCKAHHPRCGTGKDISRLPRRLIRIGYEGLKLIDTNKATSYSYVAFSYCWGRGSSMATCAANISQHYKGIPIDEIPAAIEDVVHFARQLEMTYVWIDRLCIQQDDSDDWNDHAGFMDEIYAGAELVCCAASSESVAEHFVGPFSEIARQEITSTSIEILSGFQSLQLTRFELQVLPFDIANQDEREFTRYVHQIEPLETRGWTFQERALAKRCIRYETNQLVWECKEETRLESCPHFSMLSPTWTRTLESHDGLVAATLWQSAVENYTQRNLTNPNDRLPAMAGMAANFSTTLDLVYSAGLWQTDHPQQFAWFHTVRMPDLDDDISRDTVSQPFASPHSMITGAPSWSWASVTGSVVFHQTYEVPSPWCSQPRRFHCTPTTVNAFGPVHSSAFVEVITTLVDASLHCYINSDTDSMLYEISIHVPVSSVLTANKKFVFPIDNRQWHLLRSVPSSSTGQPNMVTVMVSDCSLAPTPCNDPDCDDALHARRSFWRRVPRALAQRPQFAQRVAVKLLPLVCSNHILKEHVYLILSPTSCNKDQYERIGVLLLKDFGEVGWGKENLDLVPKQIVCII